MSRTAPLAMAAFQTFTYGRIWVFTEVLDPQRHPSLEQPLELVVVADLPAHLCQRVRPDVLGLAPHPVRVADLVVRPLLVLGIFVLPRKRSRADDTDLGDPILDPLDLLLFWPGNTAYALIRCPSTNTPL